MPREVCRDRADPRPHRSDVSGLGEDSGLDIAFLRIRFNADKPAPGTVGETKFRAQNPADPGIERGGRGSSGPVPCMSPLRRGTRVSLSREHTGARRRFL